MTTTPAKSFLTSRVAVLGSGGWGTALAVHLGRLGKDVRLWGRNEKLVAQMAEGRENAAYLPGVRLPESLTPTSSLAEALAGARCVVSAVPSHGTREVLRQASAVMSDEAVVVSATKGLEGGTLLRMSEVMEQELGPRRAVTVLSGPSFSTEFARELPTAVSIAGRRAAAVAAVSAATSWLPLPEKGSKQRSPGLVCLRIGRSNTSSGFCVGWSPAARPLPS